VYRQIGDSQGLRGVLDRMIVLATDASDQMLVQVLNWLTEPIPFPGKWPSRDSRQEKYNTG